MSDHGLGTQIQDFPNITFQHGKRKKKTTNPDTTLLVRWWSLQSVGLGCYFGLWELGVCLYIPEESHLLVTETLGHTQRGQLIAVMGLKMSQDKPALACSKHPILSVAHNRPTVAYTSVRVRCFPGTFDRHCRPDCLVISQSQPSPTASLLQGTQRQPCFPCCNSEFVQLAWRKSHYDGHLSTIKYFQ